MQKKFQVFVSSTYEDLKEERKKVQEALLMADCIPAGMEAFVASNDEQFEIIKKIIDLCDYYVLIIGGRYGSISKSGISYTEMEYDYAVSKELPILVFSIDDKIELPGYKKEKDKSKEKLLKEFRNKAMQNRMASIWKNADDLFGKVAISIMKTKNDDVRPGWIRGDDYNPTEMLKQITDLQKENKRLIENVNDLEKSIVELTSNTTELEFEDKKISISYTTSHYSYTKEITIKEIFKFVSINMINVSVISNKIEDYIAQSVGADSRSNLKEQNIAKRICNQFLALKLMYTKWIDDKGLYYGLTKKGEKLRDDLNLFKK